MTIFRNTVKRIFRSKVQLIFILLLPLAFMCISFISSEFKTKVSIIDYDQTQFTADFRENLATKALIIDPIEEDMIEDELLGLKVDYVIVIDKGFTNKLISGEDAKVQSYSVQESNVSLPIHSYIDQWLNDARIITNAVNHDADVFYSEFTRYNESGALKLEKMRLADEGRGMPRTAIGYMVMAMLYSSMVTGMIILMNKNNHSLYRTLTAPVRMSSYMLQIILSFLFISLVQIVFVLLVVQLGFHLYAGTTIVAIFVLLLVFALVSVSLGVLISSLAKNIIQAVFIGITVIPPLAMLGGGYFPLDFASDTVKTLSKFSPVSWVLAGVEKILRGQDFTTVGGEILMMLLFATIFFLLGIIRKVDIAK